MAKNAPLVVVTPNPKKHTVEMIDMCSKVFAKGLGYFECHDWCTDVYIQHSHYDWNSSSIGIVDGKIVTHYGIWDNTVRIGRAHVRLGGVGLVATHGDYRRRGLMNATARASMDLMRRNGYDISLLFGIAHYYDRFGFVNAWADTDYSADIRDLPAEKPAHKLFKFPTRRRDDTDRLYNRLNAGRTLTTVRPTYLRTLYPEKWSAYLWRDRAGKLLGYVVTTVENRELVCIECCAEDDAETLRILAELTRRAQCNILRFSRLHPDHPLRKRLTRAMCSAKTRYAYSGGPMVCTVNLNSTLSKLTGEFSSLLKNSRLADWRGSLLIGDNNEKLSLLIDRARVKVAPPAPSKHSLSGGNHVAQLLIGSTDPDEIVEAASMRLRGDALNLVRILFPDRHPRMSTWDHF